MTVAPLRAWPWHKLAWDPMTWILALALTLRLVGLGWGLPGSDGWDEDGVAPRDFLAAVYQTYDPGGDFYVYPPVHLVLLTLLHLPFLAYTLAHAPSFEPQALITHMVQVQTMTPLAYGARAVSALASVATIWALAKTAELLAGRRAGLFAALTLALNATATYYGHTTNLESAYLAWASFALLAFTRLLVLRETKHLRAAIALATLAIGTKDQAYALFLLAVPTAAALWFLTDPWPRANARALLRTLLVTTAVALVALVIVDGAITNPVGFRKRIAFLLGTGSQDHAYYSNDWAGRWQLLRDAASYVERYYPRAFLAPLVVGLGVAGLRGVRDRRTLAALALPLLVVISTFVTFNFTARRTEHRFLLPQSLVFAVYIGIGLDALAALIPERLRKLGTAALVAPPAAWGLFRCIAVDVELLNDPRYAVERFLATHVAPGETIEVHGFNVYLPRFPAHAHVTRVDTRPLRSRSPLPGVEEVEQHWSLVEERKPRWIVVSQAYAWRYLGTGAEGTGTGRVIAAGQRERERDEPARRFFHGLYEGTIGYRTALVSRWDHPLWPRFEIHSSTGQEVRVFEREPPTER